MKSFQELGLKSELVKGLDFLGFSQPTLIQEKTIPFLINSKKDLIALAQTGTGKTAAFALPILNQINKKDGVTKAIILSPTRELCLQIAEDIKKFIKFSKDISVTPVYGGERIDIQIRALKKGPDIVVGTPGRVNDLIRRRILKLGNIEWLVLDEADEMLDMGFKEELDSIMEVTPKSKQTLLFSATISKTIQSISKTYMKETEEIDSGGKSLGADKVNHEYYVVNANNRFDALQRILDFLPDIYGIIFCRTKQETQYICDKLKKSGYDADTIHGDIPQETRTKIMNRFRNKQICLLVATDVAARGVDVSNLSHIINYNIPGQKELYVHRSGRTGRADKSGVSISILSPNEATKIRHLESLVGKKFKHKKVPSVNEVEQKRFDYIIEKIEKVDKENIKESKQAKELFEKMKSIKKEDLINYFISTQPDYSKAYGKESDLNVNPEVARKKQFQRNRGKYKKPFRKKSGYKKNFKSKNNK